MSVPQCQRKWQIEAARDGRLRGKDRDSALRHRATCAECSREDRELVALGYDMSCLPELARDPMTVRRSRQRLIAALNRSILEPPIAESSLRAALALALAIAAVVVAGFAIGHKVMQTSATEVPASVVEVRAEAGTRWSERTSRESDQVNLWEGTAAFTVHPHKLRRVVIQLPDGEVEDIGTVFEIRVSERHTRRISVSQGRIAIRLRGRPAFSLCAGEAWEAEPAAHNGPEAEAAAGRISPPLSNAHPVAAAGASSVTTRSSHVAARPRASATAEKGPPFSAPLANGRPEPRAENSGSDGAEDDAYLQLLESLKRDDNAGARARAKDYLLRFPNGFRRIEVLNIAMRGTRDASDAAGAPGSVP
ncbi:MAG TPA: FecR domain-containing protein [Polyangiaceae bacterium]|nr:FecR domain-containing protein [Polyangiaceae bacterium]